MTSKLGLAFSGIYIVVAGYLIFTQGLFGESFIALILGMPWTLLLALFEFGGVTNESVMMLLILAPMVLNAVILYWIGKLIARFLAPAPVAPTM